MGDEAVVAKGIAKVFDDTKFVGLVSLLVSILLKHGPRTDPLHPSAFSVVLSAMKVFNNMAMVDLPFFQVSLSLFSLEKFLGADECQVEIFHVWSYALSYCLSEVNDGNKKEPLLQELILTIGYYTLQNERNQEILQWGKSPTILQRLCSLPFQYFSQDYFKAVLFPSLISACFQNQRNKAILEQEMNADFLRTFIQDEANALETQTQMSEQAVPPRFKFSNRFPISLWEEARTFFSEE